jgi:hypothetical protein
MENGSSAEMRLTGNDGVVGIALFRGGGTMPNRAVVQSAGGAVKTKAKAAVYASINHSDLTDCRLQPA